MWKTLTVNSAYLYALSAMEYGCAFLFAVYMGRVLGTAEFGVLMFAISLASLWFYFHDLGMARLVMIEAAQATPESERRLASGFRLRLLSLAASFVLLGVVYPWLPYEAEIRWLILALCISESLHVAAYFLSAILKGRERMDYVLYSQGLERPVILAGAIVAWILTRSLLMVAWVFLLARILILALTIYYLKRLSAMVSWRERSVGWRELWAKLRPFAGYAVLDRVNYYLPTFLIFHLLSAEAAGEFQMAFRIFVVPSAVLIPVVGALYVRAANLHGRENFASIRKLTWVAIGCAAAYGLVMAALLGMGAERLLTILFGRATEEAVLHLHAVAVLMLVYPLLLVLATLLGALGKQPFVTKAAFVALLLQSLGGWAGSAQDSAVWVTAAYVGSMVVYTAVLLVGTFHLLWVFAEREGEATRFRVPQVGSVGGPGHEL